MNTRQVLSLCILSLAFGALTCPEASALNLLSWKGKGLEKFEHLAGAVADNEHVAGLSMFDVDSQGNVAACILGTRQLNGEDVDPVWGRECDFRSSVGILLNAHLYFIEGDRELVRRKTYTGRSYTDLGGPRKDTRLLFVPYNPRWREPKDPAADDPSYRYTPYNNDAWREAWFAGRTLGAFIPASEEVLFTHDGTQLYVTPLDHGLWTGTSQASPLKRTPVVDLNDEDCIFQKNLSGDGDRALAWVSCQSEQRLVAFESNGTSEIVASFEHDDHPHLAKIASLSTQYYKIIRLGQRRLFALAYSVLWYGYIGSKPYAYNGAGKREGYSHFVDLYDLDQGRMISRTMVANDRDSTLMTRLPMGSFAYHEPSQTMLFALPARMVAIPMKKLLKGNLPKLFDDTNHPRLPFPSSPEED